MPTGRKAITSREDAGVKVRTAKLKPEEGNQECLRCSNPSNGWLLCESCRGKIAKE